MNLAKNLNPNFFIPFLASIAIFAFSMNFFNSMVKSKSYVDIIVYTSIPIIFITSTFLKSYSLNARNSAKLFRIFMQWTIFFSIIIAIGFLTKTTESLSRLGIGLSFFVTILGDFITALLYKKISNSSSSKLNMLVIHEGKNLEELKNNIADEDFSIYAINENDDFMKAYNDLKPQTVVIFLKLKRIKDVMEIKKNFLNSFSEIIWIPVGKKSFHLSAVNFANFSAFRLNSFFSGSNEELLVKRIFDILLSFAGIVILSPFLIFIYFLIVISSKGPGIYKQTRLGLNGKKFSMYKFRSMYVHDDSKYVQTLKNDKRITPIGAFIRKYSIDEIPQLFNVLYGDMSFVGPRPHALEINKKYMNKINQYLSRHKMRPGITGFAQIKGYRGGDNLEHMEKRTFYDIEYIKKWSLFLDFKILFLTPFTLFNKNIY